MNDIRNPEFASLETNQTGQVVPLFFKSSKQVIRRVRGVFFRKATAFILSLSFITSATQQLYSSEPVRFSNHVPHEAVKSAVFLSALDSTTIVPLTFTLPLRNQEELEDLVQRIYDPNDTEHYHKYLTSEEFIERFSPTQEDYDAVIDYAKSVGFTVTGTHSNRTLLNVAAPAESVENAFALCLHRYETPNGHKFYAPDDDPQVHHSIAPLINGVIGLDNYALRRPFRKVKKVLEVEEAMQAVSSQASPSGPGRGYAPQDLLTAYNLSTVPRDGSGQIIALFELASYQLSDIRAYTSYFGLPSPQLTNVFVNGGSGTGIDAEVTLDIELALALAPKSQIYVYEGPNSNVGVLNTYNRIATDNIAKQVSTSWGMGENLASSQQLQAENAIFLQMAAHGQTIYAAAGDSGAYDNYENSSGPARKTLAVDDPASQPYVVGVGGTRLTVNSQSGEYQSEVVWNNGLGRGAGGGGISIVWPIPSWQKNVATTYSKTQRNVPDVSLNSDPATGYSVYHAGQWTIVGGTSCAAPLWAAFTALVNQELVAKQKPVLGFANPVLYPIGTSSLFTADFHDVTSGNNLYYPATTGYDNATGWGSFNGANLWGSLTSSSPPPPGSSPVCNIAMTHNAPFVRGSTGTYKIQVSNQGTGSTSGVVSVAVTLPQGLSYKSFSGLGWSFNQTTQTFTQTAPLAAGANYPLISLVVNVAPNAPATMTPKATVSGGGSTSKTVTNVTTTR